jgi:hypothetical protein
MKRRLCFALFGLALFAPIQLFAADAVTNISEAGISFSYPKTWKKKVEHKPKFTVITVSRGKVTRAMVTVYKATTPPATLLRLTYAGVKQQYSKKFISESVRKIQLEILGEKRDGKSLSIQVLGTVHTNIAIYTLPLPKQKKHYHFSSRTATRIELRSKAS